MKLTNVWKAVTGFFKPQETMDSNSQQDEVENNSSSDSDDEDFIPNEANEGAVSEEDSEGEAEDNEKESPKKNKTDKKGGKRKRKAPKTSLLNGFKSKRGKFGESNDDNEKDGNFSRSSERSEDDDNDDNSTVGSAGDSAADEAHEKEETDKLWANFLTSVDEDKKKRKNKERVVEKVVNKVYDFAGQKVSVQEKIKVTVSANDALNGNNDNDSNADTNPASSRSSDSGSSTPNSMPVVDLETNEPTPGPSSAVTNGDKSKMKPPEKPAPRRGGISILGNDPETIGLDDLEKKGLSGLLKAFQQKSKKIGTLEKSKLDWENYKRQQGLEEELETHTRSRDTYIDKQEFLQRTDYRQFEIEKSMRSTQRSKRLANSQ